MCVCVCGELASHPTVRHHCSCLWSLGHCAPGREALKGRLSEDKSLWEILGSWRAHAVEGGPYEDWGLTGQPTPAAAIQTCGFDGKVLVEWLEAAERQKVVQCLRLIVAYCSFKWRLCIILAFNWWMREDQVRISSALVWVFTVSHQQHQQPKQHSLCLMLPPVTV